MTKNYNIILFILFLSGCSAKSLLVPIVGMPATNYFTGEYYMDKYQLYDSQYRESNNFTEHRISRGTHTLYAREFEFTEPTDNKPAIILMHGFPDSLHIYDNLAPQLASQYRVVSFDFLGWGKSDKPDTHTYDTASLYVDLEAVINYFKFTQVSLVVHDASGPPGIDWAIANPDKMDTLVLLNTYYYPMDDLLTPEAIVTFSTPGLKRTLIRTGANFSNYAWGVGFRNQLSKFFYNAKERDIMLPVLTHQAMEIRNAFFQLNDVLNQEAEIRLKNKHKLTGYTGLVKIVFGSKDPYLNSQVAQNLDSIFPHSSLTLVGQAAHYVQLDQPDEVSKIILMQTIANH